MRKRVLKYPFYYGWFLLGCVCLVGIARQGSAVATTSLFVTPMSEEFGWSRAVFSGAVSLGGGLAAFAAPLLGPIMDRFGARVILIFAVMLTGLSCLSLSIINSLFPFYVFFCMARMSFAGPFDLGIYGVINNWFVQFRPLATAITNVAQAAGLACMPLIASFAILDGNWRAGWLSIGMTVLIFGLIPACFLKFRQPEDVGLFPDGRNYDPLLEKRDIETNIIVREPVFSRKEALRCPAFWTLSLFTLMVFPVQAGVSLHQAPHLLERGLTGVEAAATISLFPLCGAAMTMLTGLLARKISISILLAIAGAILALSTALMLHITMLKDGLLASVLFGVALGMILTLLPVAWADFFGRKNYGSIRGISLAIQVSAQALGPIVSGVMWDLTGDYALSLGTFTVLSILAILFALASRPPNRNAPIYQRDTSIGT